jgi:hypothetical protein
MPQGAGGIPPVEVPYFSKEQGMAGHPLPDTHNNKTIGELLSDLSYQTRELISEEIALAKAEISQNLSRLMRSGVWFTVAAVLATGGLLTLLASAVLGLVALFEIAPWLAALIVAFVLLGAAFIAMQSGRSLLRRETLAPRQTIESLKENAAWIRSHTQ